MSDILYSYIDPLAVAWMAKHFGMKFWDADTGFTVTRYDGGLYEECLFNIHPDSLHLLEPQVGDLVRAYGGLYELIKKAGQVGKALNEIIQRDGKPFFWPECEAA